MGYIAQPVARCNPIGRLEILSSNPPTLGEHLMIPGQLGADAALSCVLCGSIGELEDTPTSQRRCVPTGHLTLDEVPLRVDRHDRTSVPTAYQPSDSLPRAVTELDERVISHAFQDIRDVDVAAREADLGEQLLEQLPRLADERQPLLVLVEAGRLADEHQVGMRIAGAEDDLRASLRQPASRAAGNLARVRLKRVDVSAGTALTAGKTTPTCGWREPVPARARAGPRPRSRRPPPCRARRARPAIRVRRRRRSRSR